MTDTIKLTKKDVKSILEKTYPEYTGRKFKAEICTTYHMENYYDGGTCYECTLMNFDGEVIPSSSLKFNPLTDPRAHATFTIPDDVMVVEHCHFCGQDLGIRFIVSPTSKFLPKILENAKKSEKVS